MSDCTSCSGSGYYDADGSPPCGSCNGTGTRQVNAEDLAEQLETLTEKYEHLQGMVASLKEKLGPPTALERLRLECARVAETRALSFCSPHEAVAIGEAVRSISLEGRR